MKINWHKYEGEQHVIAWFLLEAMSCVGIEKFMPLDAENLEVELKVNGVEVPIEKPMNFLQGQLDMLKKDGIREGKEEAAQQIKENIDTILCIGNV